MRTTLSPASTNLYRIVSFDRAVQMFEKNELYFSHPSTWDDPFEELGLPHDQSNNIFAQCWSRNPRSDALWRIYSPQRIGVRISTTRNKLKSALDDAKKTKRIFFQIKDVMYHWDQEFDLNLKLIAKKFQASGTDRVAVSPLFLKRDAFRHEQETRVVVLDKTTRTDISRKELILTADTHELIKDVYIDPRATKPYVDAFTRHLQEGLKFKGTVTKSNLYDGPVQPK